MVDDDEVLEIIGKTVESVSQNDYRVTITFTDGSEIEMTCGGQGEIWLNTAVTIR